MNLQILESKAYQINFNKRDARETEQPKSFEISYNVIYDAKKDNVFAVV